MSISMSISKPSRSRASWSSPAWATVSWPEATPWAMAWATAASWSWDSGVSLMWNPRSLKISRRYPMNGVTYSLIRYLRLTSKSSRVLSPVAVTRRFAGPPIWARMSGEGRLNVESDS